VNLIAIIILALSASCAMAHPGTGEVPRSYSTVYDAQGRYQGRIHDGRVFDAKGQFRGRLQDGKVFDSRGNFMGRIKQDRPGGQQDGTR